MEYHEKLKRRRARNRSLRIMEEETTSGKVKSIAKRLHIAQPSVVQMLQQEIRASLVPFLPELFLANGTVLGNLDV